MCFSKSLHINHLSIHIDIILFTAIHYGDVIMGAIASQITSITIVYWTVYSDSDQRKHQSSASLAFVRGIHRGPVNSPHKWPVTRKMFPFDDVIMFPTIGVESEYISADDLHQTLVLHGCHRTAARGPWKLCECIMNLHSQYHHCRWPGHARTQGISSRGIDIFIPISASEELQFASFWLSVCKQVC